LPWKGSVALLSAKWIFPGRAWPALCWTDQYGQRIELVGNRRGDAIDRIDLVTRVTARWSCSTMLLRYLTWRTVIGSAMPPLISSMAALLAPLLSIAIFSGAPFSRMAFSGLAFLVDGTRLPGACACVTIFRSAVGS
jgi:hypothetical protein